MKEIDINLLVPSETNPRKDYGDLTELVESIRQYGILQPIIVQRKNNKYEVIVGLRRLQAAKEAGLKTVSCIVKDFDHEDIVIAGLIENDQRKDLSWVERGRAYSLLRGKIIGKTGPHPKYEREVEEIAKLVNKSKYFVTRNLLSYKVYLKVPESSVLPQSVVENIQRAPEEDWKELVELAIENNYTEKQIREIIRARKSFDRIIEQIKDTHPEVTKIILDFWYPYRFNPQAVKDMEEEVDLRLGNPRRVKWYLPTDKFTEEEIRQVARERHGEFLGIETRSWYIILGLKRNIQEIRSKWM